MSPRPARQVDEASPAETSRLMDVPEDTGDETTSPTSRNDGSVMPHREVPSWAKALWQRIALFLLVTAARPLQTCPPGAARRFGTSLGKFGYRVAAAKRKRACANLHLAYGDAMTKTEREALTCRVFEHFGRSIVDFLRVPSFTQESLSQLVTCEGWEYVEAARASDKGIIFLTGHIGNWEIMGRWLAQIKQLPLTVVAKDPKNPALARYLRQMREGAGFAVLSKGVAARTLLKVLRKREAIILLADQNSADLFAPFFGIPTGTVAGPASLALHTDATLIPLFCLEKPDGSYHVRCFPPLEHPPGDDYQERVQEMTESMNAVLEAIVREYPEQWLWLHNRWKSSFEERHVERAWRLCNRETMQTQIYNAARKRWMGEP